MSLTLDWQAVEREAQRALSGLLNPRSAMFPTSQGVTVNRPTTKDALDPGRVHFTATEDN